MLFLGEIAALTTAVCWAFASLMFSAASRRAGAFAVNQVRITGALIILSAIVTMTRGVHWAPGADIENILTLAASGLVGLALGDWAYFSALVHIGPRLTTVMMTLAPPFTAILAAVFLGETLTWMGALGMAVTLTGVVWVVLERQSTLIPRGHRIRGVALGALGSLGQALGLVLSKAGMGSEVDPLPATAIRMAAGAFGVWSMALFVRGHGRIGGLLRDTVARRATAGATLVGPVLGVWMSLVAVRLTDTGITATLMATTPVFIIPQVILITGERVSSRSVWGALVSVAGVAILLLRP